jgi:hypothetical protein
MKQVPLLIPRLGEMELQGNGLILVLLQAQIQESSNTNKRITNTMQVSFVETSTASGVYEFYPNAVRPHLPNFSRD